MYIEAKGMKDYNLWLEGRKGVGKGERGWGEGGGLFVTFFLLVFCCCCFCFCCCCCCCFSLHQMRRYG